jgi:hypothetical protein
MASLAEVLRQAGYVTPQGVTGPNAPLAQQLKNYATNVIPTARQNLAQQRADIDAALTMGQGGVQIGDREAFERQMAQVPNLMGLTAYHGTPHTIKGKFDISKVGTGEGAQAYGHGMYFAENPAVATQYKSSTIPENALTEPQKKVVEWAKYEAGDEGPLAHLLDMQQLYTKKHGKENVDKAVEFLKGGNLYKVDIPDEYIPMMLDYDKPLSQQPKGVQKALAKYDPDMYSPKGSDYDSAELGQSIYQRIIQDNVQKFGHGGNQKRASEALNALGIKGIRYYDEGSRKAGGTSNFVVFEPSTVKILEQNSKPMTRKEIIEQELKKVVE